MPFLMLMIVGAAAGLFATRIMRVNTDLPSTVAIGVFGALIGGLVLRVLILSLGAAAGFAGAILGALLLIWLWQRYMK
jgi:uncharacterized membrane protein YeaQ/YmgE (transglycosylase-associated protein family)